MLKRGMVLIALSTVVSAADPSFNQELADGYEKIVNTIITLTSDDMMSTGRYKFYDTTTLDTYHLPVKYNFDPFYKGFNFFVNGTISYSKIEEKEYGFNRLSPDYFDLSLRMYKLGGGLRYKPNDDFYIAMGYSLIYSKYKSNYSSNSKASLDAFSKPPLSEITNFLNTTQSNWTSEFIFSSEYKHEIYGFVPYASAEYKWYRTRTDLDLEEDVKVTSQNEILRGKLGSLTPVLFDVYDSGFRLDGFVGRTYYYGDVVEVLENRYYDSYGVGGYLDFKSEEGLLDKLGIVSEWVHGEHFKGYNIGLDLVFNF